MEIKFLNYAGEFKIVSIALDEETKADLLDDNIDFLYVTESKLSLFPDEIELKLNIEIEAVFTKLNNYDVYEIWPNGTFRRIYDVSSIDNYFYVTGKCNSNCVMCPSSDYSRKNANEADIHNLIEIAKHIPTDTKHLTITGGEPFMAGKGIFEFISFLRDKYEETEFLILTNGRIFAVEEYAKLLRESIPRRCIIAIPIHGSCASTHDAITRAEGSFKQTIVGIKRLLALKIKVELRLVVCNLNLNDFDRLAELIIKELPTVEYISVMATEMTGNAFLNRNQVWVPYKKAFSSVERAIKRLIENGIDVKLYNFPLCTVKKEFWTLCEKSISPDKVRYAEICDTCLYKKACGGVFAGTFLLEKDELEAMA